VASAATIAAIAFAAAGSAEGADLATTHNATWPDVILELVKVLGIVVGCLAAIVSARYGRRLGTEVKRTRRAATAPRRIEARADTDPAGGVVIAPPDLDDAAEPER
jgi:hypothetical protein